MGIRNKDVAWDTIFESTSIYDQISRNGFYKISGKDIKRLTKAEPRLVCKYDSIEDLPLALKKHEFNLLAIKNGQYIVFKDPKYKGFLRLPELETIQPTILKYKPNLFQTLTIDNQLIDVGSKHCEKHKQYKQRQHWEKNR